jgi:hypothetical protein
LPGFAGSGDVALGPAGSLYVSAPGAWGYPGLVFRLTPSGEVIWQSSLPDELSLPVPTAQLPLRVGPDGTLYCLVDSATFGSPAGEQGWMPVATPAGAPLSVPAQRRGILWGYQPLAGWLRLVSELHARHVDGPVHEARYALVDRRGRLVRAWRILSRTEIYGSADLPDLVQGDLVVVLDVTSPLEHVVLRLTPRGTRARFSLAQAMYGDAYYPDLRVGPDGKLYQLATSPETGVVISRYALGRKP